MGVVERAAFFIDGSNFYHGAHRNDLDHRVDFNKLAMKFVVDRHLDYINYYTAPRNQADDPEKYKMQQRFFDALNRTPRLQLKLGRLEKRSADCVEKLKILFPDYTEKFPTDYIEILKNLSPTYVEKGVDVAIAVDMLMAAVNDSVDVFYLVTADADFVPAIKEIQAIGKKVFNIYFAKHYSHHLRSACDALIPITPTILNECRPDT